MKKVLALVLAVVMVCTMAMAVTINAVTPGTVAGAGDIEIGQIKLEKLDEKYVLILDNEFFTALSDKEITAKNFKVSANVKGNFVETATAQKVYAFDVANTDKALDGAADFAISTLTISLVDSKNTYVKYEAKDGKLVATEKKVGGLAVGDAALEAINADLDYYSAYDVGYETNTDKDNIQTSYDANSPVWNLFDAEVKGYVYSGSGFNVTLNGIAKKTAFKVVETAVTLTTEGQNAIDEAAEKAGATVTKLTTAAFSMTAGNATIEIPGTEDMYLYTYDKNGKLTDAGFKFVVTKDKNTGVETGKWTLTTSSIGAVLSSTKALPAAAASAGTGTTNPGTGANDVVGVAAALAVVALVSGAAISLKK